MRACVFAGPTLPPRDTARQLDFTWLPPARHGDVYRAVTLLRPRAIGIVDGYFQWVPSVWHKEILWAIHEGVHVFGAASMGALRAAELAPFGMRGVGCIFEAYRNGMLAQAGDDPFEDDDEVAVVHGPAESEYLAGSEAMVNIRCTLAGAERAGVIDAAVRAALVGIAKRLFFPERSYELMMERAIDECLPEEQLCALRTWLPAGRVDQKRADALVMLDAMRKFLAADPAPARAASAFEHTILWERAIAALGAASPHDPDEVRVLDELRLDGSRFQELQKQIVAALVARSRATDGQPAPGGSELPHESERGLDQIARQQAERRLQDEIPVPLIERQMLARMRTTGEYAGLLARADDKRARVGSRADLPQAAEFSELQLLQLRDWYFSRVQGTDMPDDLEEYLRDVGYPDNAAFHAAIFGEYVYRQMTAAGHVEESRADG